MSRGPCTRRCTTPGVRACGPRMRARLVRSAPCNSARASPVVHPRHSVNMWMWSSPKEGQATLTGIITVSWRMEAKVKRNWKEESGAKRWRNQQQRVAWAGFDAGGFRVKVNGRDSARTQGNTAPSSIPDQFFQPTFPHWFKVTAKKWGIKWQSWKFEKSLKFTGLVSSPLRGTCVPKYGCFFWKKSKRPFFYTEMSPSPLLDKQLSY